MMEIGGTGGRKGKVNYSKLKNKEYKGKDEKKKIIIFKV